MDIVMKLTGYKTYIAAAGLFGLAVYQFSQAQYEQSVQTVMAALAAVGLRSAIAKGTSKGGGAASAEPTAQG